MAYPSVNTGLLVGLFLLSIIVASEAESKEPRLSIFNIIKFENNACKGSTRNGTCYTSAECESAGGKKDGDCADGFGVCCVVTLAAGGSTSLNQSYIVQASSSSITVGPKSYQICPSSTDIRRIRLDFKTFTLAGPNNGGGTMATSSTPGYIGGAIGDCLIDTFVMTSSGGASSPVICGTNTGQHLIVDNDGQGCSMVNINIGGGSSTRSYDIAITQYRAGDESGGPMGCLQYFDQSANMIRSFNYPVLARGKHPAVTDVHLSNQDYTVCIRRAAGKSQICYMPCTPEPSATTTATTQGSFGLSISGKKDAMESQIGTNCNTDYITIPNGLGAISPATTKTVLGTSNRFCGRALDTKAAQTNGSEKSVCSISIPFRLGVHTDDNEAVLKSKQPLESEISGYPGGIIGFQLCYVQS